MESIYLLEISNFHIKRRLRYINEDRNSTDI